MAEIRAFPAVRRCELIMRNARLAASYGETGGFNHLNQLVRKHHARLLKLGVRLDEANRDTETLRNALHSQYRRFRATGGAA